MKYLPWHGWLLGALAVAGHAQEKFTDRLSAEEKKAVGLELLSPEQVAALNALVQKDRQQGAGQIREQARAGRAWSWC